jgi:Pretoxin HINT domain
VRPPPLTDAEKRARLTAALRQLAVQYHAYTKRGGTEAYDLWLADSLKQYAKDHPQLPDTEPGLESEGIGPLGFLIDLLGEGLPGIAISMGATGVERLAESIWNLFTRYGVDVPRSSGEPADGGVPPPMGMPDGGDGGGCFAAGTLVGGCDGNLVPIESIVVGDVVAARDEVTQLLGTHAIERIFEHVARPIIELELDTGERIRTTAKHRMFVVHRGFVGVQDLEVNDRLETKSGERVAITAIRPTGERDTVYNLTVHSAHTYFVGQAQIWVHNTKVNDPNEADDDESDDDDPAPAPKKK